MNLGPQNESWTSFELKPMTHVDPLIHVPTEGHITKNLSKNKLEIMDQYINKQDSSNKLDFNTLGPNLNEHVRENGDELEEEHAKSCDVKIIFEKQTKRKIHIVGQLVDISSEEENVSLI